MNSSNIENGNNDSVVKSNQGKLAFILADSMVKDVDGYLLTGSINRKFIVKDLFHLQKPSIWNITPNPPKETSNRFANITFRNEW